MGRLFWKFLFFFLLAQVATVVAVSSAIWLRHGQGQRPPELAGGGAAARLLAAAATTAQYGGQPALRQLLEAWAREPGPAVYAVDAQGRELLGRTVPEPPPRAAGPADASGPPPDARRVVVADAASFTLSVDEHPPGGAGPRHGPPGPGRGDGDGDGDGAFRFPVEPILGGVLASLVVAALLAWYVSKPIRSLRRAFDAAAEGDLDARIGDALGRRRDELADLGRDFDRTAARLKLLMDGQRRLLHDVSHELRSPLARLQAAVGLARQQPAALDASMDRIDREAERMDKLIDELLTLSRIEAGMAARPTDAVDLAELVSDVVRDAEFEADARGAPVVIEADIAALGAAACRGNAELMHRALDNVVRNAVRHTRPGSPVRIEARHEAAAHEVQLTIADEGPGVPAGELEAIFEPFFRGTSADGTRGHGLGLAIARKVIEFHGGSIAAANRETGGFVVEIRLPA